MFVATYGRLPSEFDKETAMGLAMNIPAIEARNALAMAQAISIALGNSEQAERAVRLVTGSDDLAFRAKVQMEHQRMASL